MYAMGRPLKKAARSDHFSNGSGGTLWKFLWEREIQAMKELSLEYDLLLIEGAGSPAEINPKVPGYCGQPAICLLRYFLVANIDLGGAFAFLCVLGLLNLSEFFCC